MKRYILFLFSLLFIFSSCSKEEVEEYTSGARLNFQSDYIENHEQTVLCRFTDSDYLKGITEITDSVEVITMGVSTNTDRTFHCTTAPADPEYSMPVIVEDAYTMPKNAYSTFIKFKVKAPAEFGKTNKTYIRFDHAKNTDNFAPGNKETQQCVISCVYDLYPAGWDSWTWGKFSNGKYKFMMDHFKKLHADIPDGYEEMEEIYNAYQAYKAAGNPPIMDDDTPAKEIEFININE